jgi:hypothetical protein
MCPFCLPTMGLVVASATSTGGLAAALAVKLSRKRNGGKAIAANSNERRNQDVSEHDKKSENSVAR